MLISFTLENWRSFKDETNFTMVASRERQHGQRVPFLKTYSTKILPIASIYGANASGKSNFAKALGTAKNIVTKQVDPNKQLPYNPFRLNDAKASAPTRFSFVLLAGQLMYEYSFSYSGLGIHEEKLIEISASHETELFARTPDAYSLDERIRKNKDDANPNNSGSFIEPALRGTPKNQLFLTRSVMLDIDHFKPVFNWFQNQLILITPDTWFDPVEQFINIDNPMYAKVAKAYVELDTGIEHLGGIDFPPSNLPLFLEHALQERLPEGGNVCVPFSQTSQHLMASKKNGVIEVKKLVAYHQKDDGVEIPFDFHEEADGSQRIADLLPAFLGLKDPSKSRIYVIDELDRSMHTLLTRKLLESFLENTTQDTRSQLLFTTHDVLLMDQKLFRRDEIRIAERNVFGATQLYAISDYKGVRYDKDIRKSYLNGRFGGIPKISTK